MEVILKSLDMGIVLSVCSIILAIYFGKTKSYLITSIFQRFYIIQQNNTAPNVKDNKSFTFVINKETLKKIAIFAVAVLAICWLIKYFANKNETIKKLF